MSYQTDRLQQCLFFSKDTATTEIYTLSLHDALPISEHAGRRRNAIARGRGGTAGLDGPIPGWRRSEEHTSELQSHVNLVCRLLLEKKKQYMSTLFPESPLYEVSALRVSTGV